MKFRSIFSSDCVLTANKPNTQDAGLLLSGATSLLSSGATD